MLEGFTFWVLNLISVTVLYKLDEFISLYVDYHCFVLFVLWVFLQVKLYSKQGSLKYQTDCAPNSGYYMIPVYDKGDYVLRVEPPSGWTFG